MKFFKINLLFSVAFVGLTTLSVNAAISKEMRLPASTLSKTTGVAYVPEGTTVETDPLTGLQLYATPATQTPSTTMVQAPALLPGVPTPKTAILPGVATPKTGILPGVPTPKIGIDNKLATALNNLQTTAMQTVAQKVADYLIKTYGQTIAKIIVYQMFPTVKTAPLTTTAEQTTTALTVVNTLTSTLGEGMRTAVATELKKQLFPILFSK